MDISIITSLYKSNIFLRDYCKRVLKVLSGLKHSGLDVELLIVANEPDQAELEILDTLNCLENIRIIVVPREKLYASWNRGIKEATGRVIGFWNVDDIRFVKAIEKGFKNIMYGADLVYFPFLVKGWMTLNSFKRIARIKIFRFKYIAAKEYNREEFQAGMHCGPFFIFNKDLISKVGFFDEQFLIAGDYEWCARAAYLKSKIKRNSHLAGIFQYNENTISGMKNTNLQIIENEVVFHRYKIEHKYQNLSRSQLQLFEKYNIHKSCLEVIL